MKDLLEQLMFFVAGNLAVCGYFSVLSVNDI